MLLPNESKSRRGSRKPAARALRRLVTLFLVAVSAAAPAIAADAPAAASVASAAPAPKLVVAEPVWTSEETARDRTVDHTFVLKNEGNAPLVVEHVVLTGNVVLDAKPTTIPPGGRFDLVAHTDLLREPQSGGILKQLEIRSNDPVNPALTLEMRIISAEYVAPRPVKLRWISVQQEMDGTLTSTLTAPDGIPFSIGAISGAPSGISVTYAPVVAADAAAKEPPAVGARDEAKAKDAAAPQAATAATAAANATSASNARATAWEVKATLAKNAPVGAILGTLHVEIDHPRQRIVPIPLSGFMRPVVAVTPYEVGLGEVAHVSAKEHEFVVRNFATEPIHLTKVECDVPGFGAAKIEPVELGRRYKVTVPMDLSKAPAGPLKGSIKIFTDSPKVPFYSVPVTGVVQP